MRKAWMAAAVAALAIMAGTVQAVVINEFYYGTAAPGDNEWIEIYNRGASAIDLRNWKIAVANNGPFVAVHTISQGRDNSTSVPAQNYFLIADGLAAALDFDENQINLDLGRATGTVVYGIALVNDSGTTMDTVLYYPAGGANTFNLRDDDGFTSLSRVKVVTGDQSFSRADDHLDTNDSSTDFFGTNATGGATPVPVEIRRFSLY